jgi:hypothetical protein
MKREVLERLEEWFESNCDGDWEHGYGIRIETLDNPGWMLRFDLTGTRLQDATVDRVSKNGPNENIWIDYWTDGSTLYLACGPRSLHDALEIALDLLEDPPS